MGKQSKQDAGAAEEWQGRRDKTEEEGGKGRGQEKRQEAAEQARRREQRRGQRNSERIAERTQRKTRQRAEGRGRSEGKRERGACGSRAPSASSPRGPTRRIRSRAARRGDRSGVKAGAGRRQRGPPKLGKRGVHKRPPGVGTSKTRCGQGKWSSRTAYGVSAPAIGRPRPAALAGKMAEGSAQVTSPAKQHRWETSAPRLGSAQTRVRPCQPRQGPEGMPRAPTVP